MTDRSSSSGAEGAPADTPPDQPGTRPDVWSDATAQAAAVRSGRTSAAELVAAYLDRIERFDGELRTYVSIAGERAAEEAGAIDTAVAAGDERLGPLAGVAMSVKDCTDVAGTVTTHSSRAVSAVPAAADDPVVARLRAAGAVVIGKSNLPEFCTTMTSSRLNGTCRNPWNRDLTPGGSSGGAAAGLAAGLCALAHGTDGAGSIRVPSSFCGVVGLKPGRGLVTFGPDAGARYFGTSVDGPITRSVRDAALALDVMVGGAPGGRAHPDGRRYVDIAAEPPRRLRIAVSSSFPIGEIDPDVAATVDAVAELLGSLGHDVVAAEPEWSTMLMVADGPMEMPGPAAHVDLARLDEVEPRNQALIRRQATMTVLEHAEWAARVTAAGAEFRRLWERFDVVVSPATGMLPPSVDWAPWTQTSDEHRATFATMANFAFPFNLSGQPAICLPLGASASGLPVGVQLAGRLDDEGLLLALAGELERARPWAGRHPAGMG